MELTVIASGSKGNCYLLHNDTESLMIEAGVPPSKAFMQTKLKVSTLEGLLVTHEHKDHARYIKDFLSYGLPVYMTKGTAIATKLNHPMIRTLEGEPGKLAYDPEYIGRFYVQAFRTEHDACEPCGFIIQHPEMGSMLFATDTHYLTPRFKGLNNILIECNYDERLLRDRDIPEDLKERIGGSHMSVNTCVETLLANDLSQVNKIMLIHISEGDGDPERFKEIVSKVTRRNVEVAEPGHTIYMGQTPF